MDQQTVTQHAAVIGMAGELLNATSLFLGAPDGTEEETAREEDLARYLAMLVSLDDEAVSNILLALSSLVIGTAPEAAVQAWFNNQAERIQEALDV